MTDTHAALVARLLAGADLIDPLIQPATWRLLKEAAAALAQPGAGESAGAEMATMARLAAVAARLQSARTPEPSASPSGVYCPRCDAGGVILDGPTRHCTVCGHRWALPDPAAGGGGDVWSPDPSAPPARPQEPVRIAGLPVRLDNTMPPGRVALESPNQCVFLDAPGPAPALAPPAQESAGVDVAAIRARWATEQRDSVLRPYHARRMALQGLDDVPALLAALDALTNAQASPTREPVE